MHRPNWVRALVLLLGITVGSLICFAQPVKTNYSEVELISEYEAISRDNADFYLGVKLKPDPGWHAYWINPGDAGKEPRAKWNFPNEEWKASEFSFPPPHVIPYDTLITYGYNEGILLLSQVSSLGDLAELETANISVDLSWVVCDDEICVPERMRLNIALPIVSGDPGDVNPSFQAARDLLPTQTDWDSRFAISEDLVEFRLVPDTRKEVFNDPYLFIANKDLVEYGSQSASEFNEGLFFTMEASRWSERVDETSAVLTYTDDDGEHVAIELSLTKDDGSFVSVAVTAKTSEGFASLFSITSPQTLLAAILAAFIGGLLLNLMPCVFPILSLKAINVLEIAGTDPKETRLNGLLYTAGILVAFLIIGGILLAIRASGMAVGWGFQLQSSVTNIVLALIMVAIGLNLLGVFEIGTRLMGAGSGLSSNSERTQAFMVGLLAVVVATPCVTPFMAPAIGWAFTQPSVTALSTLLALGFGLAFPYLLICYIPAIARVLPKPGAWMGIFRQIMAFPMLAMSIWLFWVVGRQLGVTSMAIALLAAVALAFTLWLYGKGATGTRKAAWYGFAGLGLIVTAYAVIEVENYREVPTSVASADGENVPTGQIESFNETRLQDYISSNQPAFVYFTADWCITCKVNERVALSSEDVKTYLVDQNIKLIEADWTTEDPTITKWLEMYGRVGVPMYLYFPVGSEESSASVLPQILTPALVIDAIEEADSNAPVITAKNPFPPSEPDWSIVQIFLEEDELWYESYSDIRQSELTDEEKANRLENELGPRPEILMAKAAAVAILEEGPTHSHHKQAVHFLIDYAMATEHYRSMIELGVGALNSHYPQYAGWKDLLKEIPLIFPHQSSEVIDEAFHMLVQNPDSTVAAHARYYQALRLAEAGSRTGVSDSTRTAWLDEAISLAQGLSDGVEDVILEKPRQRYDKDGNPIPFPKLSVAEDELLYYLENLSVGQSLPNLAAVDLMGRQDSLANYKGKVLLLDFWATWCGPCIKSLPDLRQLTEELPDDSFEIISISIDSDVALVHNFLEDPERMPWSHWYTGPDGDLYRKFQVQGIPTYVLIDHKGRVQGRKVSLDDEFKTLLTSLVDQATTSVESKLVSSTRS